MSDIDEHLPLLRELASECEVAVELGTRGGESTRAILSAVQHRLISVDIEDCSHVASPTDRADWGFVQGDSRTVGPWECDLLFIDSMHNGAQVKAELEHHGPSVSRFIAFHDVATFAMHGDPADGGGMLPEILRWMARHPEWKVREFRTNQHGLLVLEKNA